MEALDPDLPSGQGGRGGLSRIQYCLKAASMDELVASHLSKCAFLEELVNKAELKRFLLSWGKALHFLALRESITSFQPRSETEMQRSWR